MDIRAIIEREAEDAKYWEQYFRERDRMTEAHMQLGIRSLCARLLEKMDHENSAANLLGSTRAIKADTPHGARAARA